MVGEIRDRMERRLRRFAMRRMSGAWQDRHIHRTIALLLRDLDLAGRPVLILSALQDRDRYADKGEILGNIPISKPGVEPGAIPAVEGVVDIAMPARQFFPQVGGLVGHLD